MRMKKQSTRRGAAAAAFLLGVAFCLWPAQARAQQWETTGDNISNTNPGNVTVKSDTDVSPFIVRGRNTNVVGFIVSNDEAGSKAWGFQVSGSSSAAGVPNGSFIVRQASDNINPLVISPTGNVGIGTLRPNSRLDVAGSVNASGGLCMAGDCRSRWSDISSQWRTYSGTNIAYHGGNVGIGTAGPGVKLHIQTTTALDGFRLDGSNGTWATLLTNLGASSYNNIVRGGDRAIIYGGAEVGNPGGGLVIAPWASAASGLRLDAAGNVGIGTAAPGFKLDVAGPLNASVLCIGGTCKSNWSEVGGASQWATSGSNISYSSGNVGVGTTNPTEALEVVGNISATGNIAAKYQDVAEWVPSEQRLAAGTVVILDVERTNHVMASTAPYDTKVAGVVSAQPGVILGEGGEGKLMVATTGRVRVKVDARRAPIKVGDLLVTGEVEGAAMRSEPVSVGGRRLHAPGTIIGKALEPLGKGTGEILVLLSLQ